MTKRFRGKKAIIQLQILYVITIVFIAEQIKLIPKIFEQKKSLTFLRSFRGRYRVRTCDPLLVRQVL